MDGRLPLTLDDYENTEYWKLYYIEQGMKEYIEEKNEQEKKMEQQRQKESGSPGSFMSKMQNLTSKLKIPSIKMPTIK